MGKFAIELKEAMSLQGMDQVSLANKVGRTQQTVSNWLKDKSVPRGVVLKALLAAFPVEAAIKLERAYKEDAGETSAVLATRDIPLVDLSLAHLTFAEFQQMCVDFFRYKHGPSAAVHEYGVAGDEQLGIDIRVQLNNGETHSAQCKHEKSFGPADVEAAVAKQTFVAQTKYLIVTRTLTRAARDAAIAHEQKGWITWGIDDFTREIRLLDADKAELLLRRYAPGQIEHVLGLKQLTPLHTVDEYFEGRLNKAVAGHHGLPLIGRGEELQAISIAAQNPSLTAIAIVGRGGEGKSKLLYEALKRAEQESPNQVIRILDRTTKIEGAADFEQYKRASPLFVIEDAHERGDLSQLLAQIRRVVPAARMLMVTRPYTLSAVRRSLETNGFGRPLEIALSQLTYEELSQLAEAVFMAQTPSLTGLGMARQIALYTKGSPLFTVVAATLCARDKIHPSRLKSADLESVVFGSYTEEILGSSIDVNKRNVRIVAEILSLLQPIDTNTDLFFGLCSNYAGLSQQQVVDATNYLKDRGLLARYGKADRLAPDMLADYVLERTCLEVDGSQKRDIDRLLRQLSAETTGNVLANLAKLDWKQEENNAAAKKLSRGIWPLIAEQYRSGRKREVLHALKRTSFYLPQEAMAFCDELDSSDEELLRELPSILRNAAYNFPDGTIDAMKRLWKLGRAMQGELNQMPEHPIRILAELISPTGQRSEEALQAFYGFGTKLLAEPKEWGYARHPLEFIDALLSPEGHSTEAIGYNLVFQYEVIDYDRVKAIRIGLVDQLIQRARELGVREAVRAVQSLERALRYPSGMVGGHPPEELRPALEVEMVSTLEKLHSLVTEVSLPPVVLIEIARAVDWHAVYAKDSTSKPAAKILAEIAKKPGVHLALHLIDPWGHIAFTSGRSVKDRIETVDKERNALIDNELRKLSAAEVVKLVSEQLQQIHAVSPPISAAPYNFIHVLCENRPDVAKEAIREILTNPGTPWRTYAERPLAALAKDDSAQAVKAIHSYLATNDDQLVRAASGAIGWYQPSGKQYSSEEFALLQRFIESESPGIALSAVHAIGKVAKHNLDFAKQLILSANLSAGKQVLHELGSVLTYSEEIKKGFSEKDWEQVLAHIESAPDIDDWEIQELLGQLSVEYPRKVYEFLRNRIEKYTDGSRHLGRAIPHFGVHGTKLQVHKSPLLAEILADILERLSSATGLRVYHYAELFQGIAVNMSDVAKATLEAFLTKKGKGAAKALSAVLRESGQTFAITEHDFAKRVLEQCDRIDEDLAKQVADAIYIAGVTGMRGGTAGQPFPEDVRLRDGATEILETLSSAHPAWRLYRNLQQHAIDNIEETKRENIERWQ